MANQHIPPSSTKCLLLAALAMVVGLAGCAHRPPHEGGPDGERASAAIPNMTAQESFFEGKLLVEANLGRGFSGRGPGGGSGGRSGPGGGRRGDGMSMSGGIGGVGMGGGPGGPGGGPTGEMGGPGGGGGLGGPVMHESNQPPVALRLRLTNKGTATVEVTFVLCKSELGDFAVRPEKLALAPEQTDGPEPMTSRLGLPSDKVILRVSLRMGGKTEQKDLVLRAAPQTEPGAAPKP